MCLFVLVVLFVCRQMSDCACGFSGCVVGVFFFKQKTAYEMRISDGSSDVCSSDLLLQGNQKVVFGVVARHFFLQDSEPLRMVVVGRAEIGRASCRERVCQYV